MPTDQITTTVKPPPAVEAIQREVDLLNRLEARMTQGESSPYLQQCVQLTAEIVVRMQERLRLNQEFMRKG